MGAKIQQEAIQVQEVVKVKSQQEVHKKGHAIQLHFQKRQKKRSKKNIGMDGKN